MMGDPYGMMLEGEYGTYLGYGSCSLNGWAPWTWCWARSTGRLLRGHARVGVAELAGTCLGYWLLLPTWLGIMDLVLGEIDLATVRLATAQRYAGHNARAGGGPQTGRPS